MSVLVKKRELKCSQWNKTTELNSKINKLCMVSKCAEKKFGPRYGLESREMSSCTVAAKCSDSLIMIYSAAHFNPVNLQLSCAALALTLTIALLASDWG